MKLIRTFLRFGHLPTQGLQGPTPLMIRVDSPVHRRRGKGARGALHFRSADSRAAFALRIRSGR